MASPTPPLVASSAPQASSSVDEKKPISKKQIRQMLKEIERLEVEQTELKRQLSEFKSFASQLHKFHVFVAKEEVNSVILQSTIELIRKDDPNVRKIMKQALSILKVINALEEEGGLRRG
jgi:uncharacterized protein (UPF0335 family)